MKPTVYDINSVHVESFDSFWELLDYAEHNPNPLSSDKDDADFSMCASLADAISMARAGWSEVRPKVDDIFDSVAERIADRLDSRFQTLHNYSGFSVDMGRYLQGDPECMLDYVPEEQRAMGRVVKIVFNVACPYYIPAETILRRGVAIVALIDTLHKLGVGIELWADESIEGRSGGKYSNRCKIHESSQMLDINSVMFAVAHPAMLRRVLFSMQEQSKLADKQGAKIGGGYGLPVNTHRNAGLDFDVVVDKLEEDKDFMTTDPVGWVLSTVSGLGLTD